MRFFRLLYHSIDHESTHCLFYVISSHGFLTIRKYLFIRFANLAYSPILNRFLGYFVVIRRLKTLFGCSILEGLVMEDLLLGLKISNIINLIFKEEIRIFICKISSWHWIFMLSLLSAQLCQLVEDKDLEVTQPSLLWWLLQNILNLLFCRLVNRIFISDIGLAGIVWQKRLIQIQIINTRLNHLLFKYWRYQIILKCYLWYFIL